MANETDQYLTSFEDIPWTRTWAPDEKPRRWPNPGTDAPRDGSRNEAASFDGGEPVDGELPGGYEGGAALGEMFGLSMSDEPRENEQEPEPVGDLERCLSIRWAAKSKLGR